MTTMLGILILINAHGAVIMQHFPAATPTVCVAHMGDKVATCYQQADAIKGTPGYTATRTLITLQVTP